MINRGMVKGYSYPDVKERIGDPVSVTREILDEHQVMEVLSASDTDLLDQINAEREQGR